MDTFVRIARNNGKPTSKNDRIFYSIDATPMLKECIGPEGFETYAQISPEKNTAPHIDLFPNATKGNYIILNSSNERINAKVYGGESGNTTIDSISQYFLENKRSDNLQYFLHKTNNEYRLIIPGLLYDRITGVVLGYLKTLVADENGEVKLEVPSNVVAEYIITKDSEPINFKRSGNIITIKGITSDEDGRDLIISDGTNNCEFDLHVNFSNYDDFIVKDVSSFVNYTIAAQITDGKINNIVNLLTETTDRPVYFNDYYGFVFDMPKLFRSFRTYVSTEVVVNPCPGIYKVPASLVPDENGNRKLMVDVVGISANSLGTYSY